ncbi:MAG: glycosyl hydrolase family 8 [Ignavibacteriales bacterium]|nr:glycosyl hydrolase family 8 [Ignavibacteriales bacterium]
MKRCSFLPLILLMCGWQNSHAWILPSLSDTTRTGKERGSYYTGIYQNLFRDLLGISEVRARARVDSAFVQLFHGNDSTERVYYPVEPEMAYIEDIAHNDVRTEGMSYGMMIAVQLDKKNEFDRLWKWAKTFMQHKKEPRKTYFAWHCNTDGTIIDSTAASDGEEWFVTCLFFASARWGNGDGIFNYKVEAQAILDAMLSKDGKRWSDGGITPMFSKKERQVVFVPTVDASWFTDPSYHLPHYYELWARWADKNNSFWCEAAATSRGFFRKAAHPTTGLMPDYSHFDGSPLNWREGGNNDFRFDAWRVAMNVAVDYAWFARDPWAVPQSNRLLDFFHSQGIGVYGNLFTLDGKKLADDHSAGLVAMNAVACLASTNANRREFVAELWNTSVPNGLYRYYDGLLYMMAMLQVNGSFKIYDPTGKPPVECPGMPN